AAGTEAGAEASARAASPAAAAPLAARPPVPAASTERGDETIPLRGMRARIAEQMVRSKQLAPHFTYADECDMTEVARLREAAKPLAAERGVHLTFLPFLVKALVAAVRKHPVVNSVVDEENQAYVMRGDCHVGIATDTEAGLMVPVVKYAGRRSVLDLAAEIQHLTALARSRRIALEDLKGGTISITSAGSIGGILATPILNHPEVAILGVYRIQDRPVVRDGEIVIRKMTNLSITLDHRIVDGASAARFMNDLIRYLETPGLLLLDGGG
ncbi:MAG: dihydrolipoamide acetyltransferase family protein, partial [Planctomycetota bacterium]